MLGSREDAGAFDNVAPDQCISVIATTVEAVVGPVAVRARRTRRSDLGSTLAGRGAQNWTSDRYTVGRGRLTTAESPREPGYDEDSELPPRRLSRPARRSAMKECPRHRIEEIPHVTEATVPSTATLQTPCQFSSRVGRA